MKKRKSKMRGKRTPQEAFKIIVAKHADGYVAYPLGLKGVVIGQGDSYEQAMAEFKSAIRFHIETFGKSILDVESPAHAERCNEGRSGSIPPSSGRDAVE
ncbi:MAG TPA: type II toxin-antitoxin system HicB family antitoxin [Gemmataceae bacterium]|nr:type II toxin-antitoxin system HicB family antitoxin [Gemmataceae bacterium]